MAAPKTGVIIASIRNAKKMPIETKGSSTLLCLIPGIVNVRLVINKLVKETVELIPAKTTETSNKSCAPTPVYFILDAKGVINVHPAVVRVRLEHFVKYNFFRLILEIRLAAYQNVSGYFTTSPQKNNLNGTPKKSEYPVNFSLTLPLTVKKKS